MAIENDYGYIKRKGVQTPQKADGTYNVKVCIHHNRKRVFMDTEHYVTDKKLDKNLKIKDTTVNRILYVLLDDYRDAISRLGLCAFF